MSQLNTEFVDFLALYLTETGSFPLFSQHSNILTTEILIQILSLHFSVVSYNGIINYNGVLNTKDVGESVGVDIGVGVGGGVCVYLEVEVCVCVWRWRCGCE